MITSNNYIIDYAGVRSQEKIMDVWRWDERLDCRAASHFGKTQRRKGEYDFFFSLMKRSKNHTRSVFYEKIGTEFG